MRESGNHVNASTRLFHVLMLFSAMGAAQLAKSYDDYACVFQTDGQTEIAWDENTICRVPCDQCYNLLQCRVNGHTFDKHLISFLPFRGQGFEPGVNAARRRSSKGAADATAMVKSSRAAGPASKRARFSQGDTPTLPSSTLASPFSERPGIVLNNTIPTGSAFAFPGPARSSDGSPTPPLPSVGGGGYPPEAKVGVLTVGGEGEDCQRHVPEASGLEAQHSSEASDPSAGTEPGQGVEGAAAGGASGAGSYTNNTGFQNGLIDMNAIQDLRERAQQAKREAHQKTTDVERDLEQLDRVIEQATNDIRSAEECRQNARNNKANFIAQRDEFNKQAADAKIALEGAVQQLLVGL